MTASPCLSNGTSGLHLGTYSSSELLTNNTSPTITSLLSCNQVVEHPITDRLLELLRCIGQNVSHYGVLNCPNDLAHPSEVAQVKCADPVQLQLAKLQLLLSLAGQTVTPEAQSIPSSLLCSRPDSCVSPKLAQFSTQNLLCDELVRNEISCTVADELQHRKENVLPASLTEECVPKSSSNLLHQLLSGADIAQVRNRSGLIESNFSALGTPELSTGESFGCLDYNQNQELSTEISTGFGATTQFTCVCGHPSSTNICATPSVPSPPVSVSTNTTNMTEFPSDQPNDSSFTHDICCTPPSVPFTEKLLALVKEMEAAIAASSSLTSDQPKALSTSLPCPLPSPSRAAESTTRNLYVKTSDSVHSNHLRQLLVAGLRPSTPPNSGDDYLGVSQSSTPSALQRRSGLNYQNCSSSAMTFGTAISSLTDCNSQQPQGRPRSHSDLQQETRYRHKLHRAHRPRSHSKTEKTAMSVRGFIETEKLTRELESSLFAQLVLNSDPPSHHETDDFPHTMNRVQSSNTLASPISDSQSVGSKAILTCFTPSRDCVFEWLREADLFIAEHCREIPLGTLLAVAISPARINLVELCKTLFSSPYSETVPSSAKRVTAKMWHQFLLLSLCEHRCVPTASSLSADNVLPVEDWKNSLSDQQPAKRKLLTALHSLAALEVEDPPPVDTHLVEELSDFVSSAASLNLSPSIYKSLRFCILAQNAHPHHFSTSYTEALSELQAELSDSDDSWMMIQVLKLLNRLHCFDSASLKLFFGLTSTNPIPSPLLHNTENVSSIVSPSAGFCHSILDMSIPLTFKRKATHSHNFVGSENYEDRDRSPVCMRSRAYTTNSYNKSARLSEINATGQLSSRNRSDTVPMGDRTAL